jgi:hypothetical protein
MNSEGERVVNTYRFIIRYEVERKPIPEKSKTPAQGIREPAYCIYASSQRHGQNAII